VTGFHPLVLHLRSRHAGPTVIVGVMSTSALWWLAGRLDSPSVAHALGMGAVAGCVAVAGRGLGGADMSLDRTASLDWRPRRAAHLVVVAAVAFVTVATTVLTGNPLGQLGVMARNAAGAAGLLGLAAATLGTSRAWLVPVLWIMSAPRVLHHLGAASATGYAEVLTWSVQPGSSGPAALTALVLGTVGTLVYALAGPRP
jgi:hypothetical protein